MQLDLERTSTASAAHPQGPNPARPVERQPLWAPGQQEGDDREVTGAVR